MDYFYAMPVKRTIPYNAQQNSILPESKAFTLLLILWKWKMWRLIIVKSKPYSRNVSGSANALRETLPGRRIYASLSALMKVPQWYAVHEGDATVFHIVS